MSDLDAMLAFRPSFAFDGVSDGVFLAFGIVAPIVFADVDRVVAVMRVASEREHVVGVVVFLAAWAVAVRVAATGAFGDDAYGFRAERHLAAFA